MRYLIDTHVFLWWVLGTKALPEKVVKILSNPDHKIFVSAATAYEIQLKVKLEKLVLSPDYALSVGYEVMKEGWKELPISLSAAETAGKLTTEHRDPFDRLIAAQALTENIPLISIDDKLDCFEVVRIWE